MPLLSSLSLSLALGTWLVPSGATIPEASVCTNGNCSDVEDGGAFFLQTKSSALRTNDVDENKSKQSPFPADFKESGMPALASGTDALTKRDEDQDEDEDEQKPGVTQCKPFPCKVHKGPLQIIRQEGPWYSKEDASQRREGMTPMTGYGVKKLAMKTGTYTDIWDIPFSATTPNFKYLNAVGINPKDGIAYGCLQLNQNPGNFFIVRFDQKNRIEFVAKMEGAYDPVAGAFDSKGNYFFVHNTNGSYNPVLFKAPKKLHTMQGFLKQAKAPKWTDLAGLILWKTHHFADIVAVSYDLEGSGKDKEYILAINRERQAAMIDWNAGEPQVSVVHRFTTNNPFPRKTGYMSFGAAWNFKGRVFFSANDGFGVFETKRIDFNRKTMYLEKVGDSAKVINNDGFNCWGPDSPFEGAPDPRVRVVSAFRK